MLRAQGSGLGHRLAYFYMFCSCCPPHKGQYWGVAQGCKGLLHPGFGGTLDVALRVLVLRCMYMPSAWGFG